MQTDEQLATTNVAAFLASRPTRATLGWRKSSAAPNETSPRGTSGGRRSTTRPAIRSSRWRNRQVHEILAPWPLPLRVLDAACGTGRHTIHAAGLGHDVTGVDASPWMLGQAAVKNPDLSLVEGKIDALPFPTDEFDAAICALLFDHLPRIDHAIGELARVVRPGGRLLISNIHPTMALAGAHASFRDANGEPNFMRSYHHSVSSYLGPCSAFDGLTVVDCQNLLEHRTASSAVRARN